MPAREPARQMRAALTRINVEDSLAAFGLQPGAAFSGLLRKLLWWPADGFAARMLAGGHYAGTGCSRLTDGARTEYTVATSSTHNTHSTSAINKCVI